MANIDFKLNEIRETFNGYPTREIIVEILKRINEDGGNASSLNNVPASEWALAEEIETCFNALIDSVRKTDKISNDEATKDFIPTTKAIFGVLGDVTLYP